MHHRALSPPYVRLMAESLDGPVTPAQHHRLSADGYR
jgi:hypothetical protein